MQIKSLIAVLVMVMLSGCATDPASQAKLDQLTVAKRAQERWEFMIEGRLESAYEYLATGYRQVTPYSHYQKSVKGRGIWKSAKVEQVVCESDSCEVKVKVKIEIHYPLMRGPIRTENVVSERWVKDQEGFWGFLPTSS